MQLSRVPHDPSDLADFFTDALGSLGALVERSWHDRLEIVAEGAPARLWNESGSLHETQVRFLPRNATGERDAAREVFPGCPLTFRLVELLVSSPRILEHVVLTQEAGNARLPTADVLERLWRQQFPQTQRWKLPSAPRPAHHFSLVGLVRCEVQAIDQLWSLHRLAVSLPHGESDHALASAFMFAQPGGSLGPDEPWPHLEFATALSWLRNALELDLKDTLASLRARQERYLRQELERIDSYFAAYERELVERKTRGPEAAARRELRMSAARAERERRRADQLSRHAIHVVPRLEGLLITAEPAWSADIEMMTGRESRFISATFIPRSRTWSAAG